jgi:ribokinase
MRMPQPKIVVVGSLNMDLIARTSRIPAPGETILGHDFRTAPGGKGANQAVAAARAGARVRMVGRVGRDAFGEELLANLDANEVDHRFVLRDETAATGVAVIVVDDAGENSIVVLSGANMQLTPADVEAAEAAIAEADLMLLQLEIPLPAVQRAAELGRKHGVQVVLNPAPARSLPADLLRLIDVLIPNETETALLTGMPIDTIPDLKAAAAALRAQGPAAVILTLGARGALLSTADQMLLAPAFPVMPVDTTAAGDAFAGGFGAALAGGKSLFEAVRQGNAAGALAATRLGAQPSLPTRSEIAIMLAEAGDNG